MLFGIIALFVVGASWCLVGIVMGRAPREGIDAGLVQFVGAAISVTCSIIISLFFVKISHVAPSILFWSCASYVASGAFNYAGGLAMSAGMQRGPNGPVWGIVQSALIFPFAVGIIFFGTQLTVPRGAGILLLISAITLFAMVRNVTSRNVNPDLKGSWRFYAFLSFSFFAVQQNLNLIPSYYPCARDVSPILRSLSFMSGTLIAATCHFGIRYLINSKLTREALRGFRNPRLYIYCGGMQFFNLIFAYTLYYPGMDALAKVNAGAICYPLMVGSCIVSFVFYSALALKERLTWQQILAILLCVLGLTGLCLPA